MGPEEFKKLMKVVYDNAKDKDIYSNLINKVKNKIDCDTSDIKAAVLALKADGKVMLDEAGKIVKLEQINKILKMEDFNKDKNLSLLAKNYCGNLFAIKNNRTNINIIEIKSAENNKYKNIKIRVSELITTDEYHKKEIKWEGSPAEWFEACRLVCEDMIDISGE